MMVNRAVCLSKTRAKPTLCSISAGRWCLPFQPLLWEQGPCVALGGAEGGDPMLLHVPPLRQEGGWWSSLRLPEGQGGLCRLKEGGSALERCWAPAGADGGARAGNSSICRPHLQPCPGLPHVRLSHGQQPTGESG